MNPQHTGPEKMNADDRDRLLDALLDGSISEADLLRVEAELTVDPMVRKQFYRRLQLDMVLEREANAANESETHALLDGVRWSSRSSLLAGVLLGLAASLLLAFFLYPGKPDLNATSRFAGSQLVEPSAKGFAILKGQSAAVWSQAPVAVGDFLPEGELLLQSGSVHIEFFSGVQMVISGQARFSIDSPMQLTLHSGLARAEVPEPAQGFAVKTHSGDIIDLGTEFALNVDENLARVRVLDGEVELQPLGHDSQRIQGGSAVSINRTGAVAQTSDSGLDLIGPADFQAQLHSQQQERIAQWQSASRLVRSDPRLVLYYQFPEDDLRSREIANLSTVGTTNASNGAVVAAERTTDRWGRSGQALDFSRVGSRVRVNVPGEYSGLTLNCWVKINSLDRWFNSLFLTDGHEDYEPHWQIMDDGRIFFSVKVPKPGEANQTGKQHEFYSPSIWDASLSGRWIMLSVTYDVDNSQVTHYLNGSVISSERIPGFALVESIRVGAASICNWNEPMYRSDATFVVRNLNGSMDEFAMYSGALSAKEIHSLYTAGNPHDVLQ